MTTPVGDISRCHTDLSALADLAISEVALILGDQLNASHSWFKAVNTKRLFVLMEIRQETDYVTHHIQKVIGFFAAMRQFAQALASAGHQVFYFTLDAKRNQQDITGNLTALSTVLPQLEKFSIQQPDEYRLDKQLQDFSAAQSIAVEWFDTEHFLCQRSVLDDWFGQQKQVVMETFYRRMRKSTGYLMRGGKPLGGKWNYDKENRNKLPKEQTPPAPLCFGHDVSELAAMLARQQVKTIGTVDAKNYLWPINRAESRQLLDYFIQYLLPNFGRFQDAMHTDFWALYHARISFSLNTKMLSPREVVERALSYWQQHQDVIDRAQIEGFIRQIIGWREFIRAIYWQRMPTYAEFNFFDNSNTLPDFYWTGATQMACLSHTVKQSLEFAYAHHIQRLMVTGNFALLLGVNPTTVDSWYLGIYNDAIEWVELPNTRGMSQFADGGILATKPYISSGSYINKMSNYCQSCAYQVDKKVGERACPFNSLYWNFIDQHFNKLKTNPRMALMTKQWEQRSESEKKSLRTQAKFYIENVNKL
ncbi:cryptochrome/photolyase family protein [Pseudidiomarina woesei]|uniref:Uncharacterized protein related to deoxyribodipyrimidine photolyase n=1 Tax=Pseudidiomarina woesei TaxID=1381080 RepID=A0A0K6H065_9GAMM|nr:cryptochrome/photolyase family protein [Pseudidiomarina woesei]CUA84270.1 Uncharacterized protein related to deoxyribodipyrimidine photolyase [Pseudidiomarina woesei]